MTAPLPPAAHALSVKLASGAALLYRFRRLESSRERSERLLELSSVKIELERRGWQIDVASQGGEEIGRPDLALLLTVTGTPPGATPPPAPAELSFEEALAELPGLTGGRVALEIGAIDGTLAASVIGRLDRGLPEPGGSGDVLAVVRGEVVFELEQAELTRARRLPDGDGLVLDHGTVRVIVRAEPEEGDA